MPDFEDYCRCPGCGVCSAHAKVRKLETENTLLRGLLRKALAYVSPQYPNDLELRKAIDAVLFKRRT